MLISGDPERRTRAERIANGVPIDDETWRELTTAARTINVLIEAPRARTLSDVNSAHRQCRIKSQDRIRLSNPRPQRLNPRPSMVRWEGKVDGSRWSKYGSFFPRSITQKPD